MEDSHHTPVFHLDQLTLDAIVSAFGAVLDEDERVLFAYLYGSAIERPDIHDLDVGLYLTPEAYGRAWEAEGQLEEALEARAQSPAGHRIPVDVRAFNEAPLHATFRIITGRLLSLRNREVHAAVLEYVLPRYFDMQPLREQAVRDLVAHAGHR
ncbi:MAG: nucleotidyltransferase domain-containing protein [Actinobacteria bacterium]|nr:nucleotidyltransferase domain-containing protein [Actinomycetota bacterium]